MPNHTQNRYKQGSVERRGAAWYFRYRTATGRERVRIGSVKDFPSKKAAERACAGIRERINTTGTPAGPKTMADVVARYIMEELPARPSTAKNYRHYLNNHILPQWGERPIMDVKAYDVRAWLRSIPLGDKSRAHIHGLMRVLFRFAMLWEWHPPVENPMRLFKLEGATRRKKAKRVLTPDEFHTLTATLAEPYRTMATVCGCLGLRCSELFGLKWGDIDWHGKKLKPARAAVGKWIDDVKTARSGKPVPLADELIAVLMAHRASMPCADADDWVFPSSQRGGKKPYNAYAIQRYQLTPAAERAGLGSEVGWHTLRHSYRTWLDSLGTPVGVQQDLMRHSDIRTTMNIYGDSLADSLREPQERIAKMLLQ